MNSQRRLKWKLEGIWWLISVILAVLIMLPVLINAPDYPFLIVNLLYVVVFVQAARHIFFLKYSPLASQQVLKVVLFFLCIPGIFMMVEQFNGFQVYRDNYGLVPFMTHLPVEEATTLGRYITTEMVFFATVAIISTFLFALRMIASVWRYRNRGKA